MLLKIILQGILLFFLGFGYLHILYFAYYYVTGYVFLDRSYNALITWIALAISYT